MKTFLMFVAIIAFGWTLFAMASDGNLSVPVLLISVLMVVERLRGEWDAKPR